MNAFGREELLRRLNLVFEAHQLPVWELRQLGDFSKDEYEIHDFSKVTIHSKNILEITFHVTTPEGAHYPITVSFGGKLIYVLPVFTFLPGNESHQGTKICLQKHWSIELGHWCYQLPHTLEIKNQIYKPTLAGWEPCKHPTTLDIGIQQSHSSLHHFIEHIFGEHIFDNLMNLHIQPLGNFLVTNTVTQAESHLLSATLTKPLHSKQGEGAQVFLDWPQVMHMIEHGKNIVDVTTIAILLKAARQFKIA